VIKLWGGSRKKAKRSERKKCKSKIQPTREAQTTNNKKDIIETTKSTKEPIKTNNVLDFEALSKMYAEHMEAQYRQQVAVGNETAQTIYAQKQQSLKFLSL